MNIFSQVPHPYLGPTITAKKNPDSTWLDTGWLHFQLNIKFLQHKFWISSQISLEIDFLLQNSYRLRKVLTFLVYRLSLIDFCLKFHFSSLKYLTLVEIKTNLLQYNYQFIKSGELFNLVNWFTAWNGNASLESLTL